MIISILDSVMVSTTVERNQIASYNHALTAPYKTKFFSYLSSTPEHVV